MLIIEPLYISRYKRVVRHPFISRYSYSTRKCTSGCANTTVPPSLFIHTMKKIQYILHICNKGIDTPSAAIVFLLSEYSLVMRCYCISPWKTDNVHNFLLKASISHFFPDKRIAGYWSLRNGGCDLFYWSGGVNVAFFCGRIIGYSTSNCVIIGNHFWFSHQGVTMIPDAFPSMTLEINFGRLGINISLHPIWDFSNTFIFQKVLVLKTLR